MKVLYLYQLCIKEEVKELLEFVIESCCCVKLQFMKMDEIFWEWEVWFVYQDLEIGKWVEVFILEEFQYNLVCQMFEEEEEIIMVED